MQYSTLQRWSISALAATSILYGLVVLWMIATQQSIPLGCLLANTDESPLPGLQIRDVSRLRQLEEQRAKEDQRGEIVTGQRPIVQGMTPEVGDHVIQVGGYPIRSFSDWAAVHRRLRSWPIDPAARLTPGKDPSEDLQSGLALVEYHPGKLRSIEVWFLRPGQTVPMCSWLPLVSEPPFGITTTFLWFLLQACVVVVGGIACWSRPFDVPVRIFYALSAVTLIAFVGGSHWWVIAGSPLLIVMFAVAGILLPAVLLHFFLEFPYPHLPLVKAPALTRLGLYLAPGIGALAVSVWILAPVLIAQDFGSGPFAQTLERLGGEVIASFLPSLRAIVFTIFGISLAYFVVSFLAMLSSLKSARNALIRNQVRSMLWAAGVAGALIAYTIFLAITDEVRFALGLARVPMFSASLAFMLAYGVGIARYKLLLLDQVVSRGVWYYGSSVGLAIVFAGLIAVGAVYLQKQQWLQLDQTLPLAFVLVVSVLALSWGRDAVQRNLDRRFFSEKYQLDKALNRMNTIVAGLLEPEAVSDSLLNSCREVLHVGQAALYLRKKDRLEFRMFTAAGRASFPLQITLEPAAFDALQEGTVLLRAAHSLTPAQGLLRELRAEAVHGIEMQGRLGGLLVLGAKPNVSPFSAEDLAFVSAMARITGVALHCATVQQDLARLDQDLQLKIDKIEDQNRQLSVLQSELAALSQMPNSIPAEVEFRRGGIKGRSPAITHVLETIRKVAGSNSSVLIRGESGAGKELLARAIHDNSPRSQGPMISVHCAALSPALLESELFGHVKGAFTDARQDKVGRFQMANGGTLFLDEIGDISLDVQVKLLRVLQERTFEPVGGTQSVSVDVRIVTATHRNLEQLIVEGKFREDLFYRLNVISITLPPLRERKEDLYELALHFLRNASENAGKKIVTLDDEALQALQAYHWPGNIRELQNVIERAVVLAEQDSVRLIDLPMEFRKGTAGTPALPPKSGRPSMADPFPSRPTQLTLRRKTVSGDQSEPSALRAALDECNGNKAEAARLLGMPRSTFFSKLKKYDIS